VAWNYFIVPLSDGGGAAGSQAALAILVWGTASDTTGFATVLAKKAPYKEKKRYCGTIRAMSPRGSSIDSALRGV
jgi:hypothetical protein